MRMTALVLSLLLAACGGGSSPTAPTTTTTTLPPRDGVIVLNGSIGGRFVLSSSPAELRRTLYGCGDAEILVPYRETAGGGAVGGDYEVRLLEYNDGSARIIRGQFTTTTIAAGESGTLRINERFVCIEYTTAIPPRAQVALNFGGRATGAVSQIRGTGPLTVVQ